MRCRGSSFARAAAVDSRSGLDRHRTQQEGRQMRGVAGVGLRRPGRAPRTSIVQAGDRRGRPRRALRPTVVVLMGAILVRALLLRAVLMGAILVRAILLVRAPLTGPILATARRLMGLRRRLVRPFMLRRHGGFTGQLLHE